MLGLAHGMTGIILFSYTSFGGTRGIVDNRDGVNFSKTYLWYHLKDKLIPRLKGKLGKTLMELDYTGDYLQDYKIGKMQSNPALLSTKDDFLTLDFDQAKSVEKYWHCGMFTRPKHPDDKYFFLANVYTETESRAISIKIIEEKNNYKNYRFRNIEGKNDSTFTDQLTIKITHPKGEGYLYQVAPVIKYGGKLLYSEETEDGMELTDDMIIDNGAVLTINGNYNSNANILVKNGRVTYKNNGRINFTANKKLITK